MDIGTSFSYVFQDPEWIKKVLIGGAILLVGLLFSWVIGIPLLVAIILLLGYTLTTTRNVAEGSARPLPEWNDFGALFMKGLYAAIGIIILYLPTIIIAICVTGLSVAASGSAASSSRSGGDALASTLALVTLCFNCLSAIYSLVVGLYIYAPLTRYALNGQLSTFWDFRGNLAFIQTNVGGYVIAIIMAIVASFIGGLGIIACLIGLPFTAFYAQLVTAHLFGQFARGSTSPTMMTPPPMTPAPTTM